MKRLGNIYQDFISIDNIETALIKACKSNGRSTEDKAEKIKKIRENPRKYVEDIHSILTSGEYKTSGYSIYPFYEPKLRIIYALPFYPDRIVHHALLNILESYWDNRMQSCSYACRKGYGQHNAGTKCAEYTRKYKYCAQFDISQFYVSIDHAILKDILKKKLKDKKILNILFEIIDSIDTRKANLKLLYKLKEQGDKNPYIDKEISKLERYEKTFNGNASGLPIGSYTSQWFGNLYMNEVDVLLKQQLHCKACIRYCDDFLVFSNSKEELHNVKEVVLTFLKDSLKLLTSKAEVFPTSQGVYFCGYRFFPKGFVLVRKRTVKREKKMVKEIYANLLEGKASAETSINRLASIKGVLDWANSYNLRQSLGIDTILKSLKEIVMQGYPKNLNTKFDYLFVKENFDREYWQKDFQDLLDSMSDWFCEDTLGDTDKGIEDETHKIVIDKDTGVKSQFVYKENPNCKLYRLGFTKEEVESYLKS